MEKERIIELSAAMDEGQQWASSLTVGAIFRGTHGEGRHRYPEDAEKADFFGTGDYAVVKWLGIWADEQGVIVKLENYKQGNANV